MNHNQSTRLKADMALLMVTAIWGSSFPLMRNVLDHLPAFAYLAQRFVLASIVLILFLFKVVRKSTLRASAAGASIGALLFGGMALQVYGLHYTTASNSAFITGMNVVFVPVVAALVFRRKADRYAIAGLVLASAGMFLLTGGPSAELNFGDFLTLLSSVCFAFQIVMIDHFARQFDTRLLAFWQISTAALLNVIVWRWVEVSAPVWDPTVVLVLVVTGVFGTAVAFGVQTIAQGHTSPTHTAVILTAEPVFGLIFSLIIPDSQGHTETLKLISLAGCLMILMGMSVSEFGARWFRKQRIPREE